MTADPNPQPWVFSAYEAVALTVEMDPRLTTPWTGSETFELNIRDEDGNVKLQITTFTVTDFTNGVLTFGTISSAQTGATLGTGDYRYDAWRTDAGNEKRLTWGPLSIKPQQWKL